MIPYQVDPSLYVAPPAPVRLDDGFAPPAPVPRAAGAQAPAAPTELPGDKSLF